MEFNKLLKKCDESNNFIIYTSLCKAQRILLKSYTPICSISGGTDSDIVLDLMHKVNEDGKVKSLYS